MKLYSKDILSAKIIPWSMRDFVNHFGGTKKLRYTIWRRHFIPEYVKEIVKGANGPHAVRRAHKLCNYKVYEVAYESGYIEKTGKHESIKCVFTIISMQLFNGIKKGKKQQQSFYL